MTPEEIARYYENNSLGSFSTMLMDLIGKADYINRDKINQIFPEYIEAYKIWYYKDTKK